MHLHLRSVRDEKKMNLTRVTNTEERNMTELFPKINPYPIRKPIEHRRDTNEEWDIAVQKVRMILRNSRAFNNSVIRDAIVCKDIKAPAREKWEAAKALISMEHQ